MAVRSMSGASRSGASSSGRGGWSNAVQEKGVERGMRRQVVRGTRQRGQSVVVSANEKRSHGAAVTCASASNTDRLSRCTCRTHNVMSSRVGEAAIPRVRPAEMLMRRRQAASSKTISSSCGAVADSSAPTTQTDGVAYTPPPSVGDALANVDYAIVEVGGQQLIVQEGRHYIVNHLNVTPGTKIALNRVYGVKKSGSGDGEEAKFIVGKPVVENASVEAIVLQTVRAPKVTVFKFKRKKHYKKTQGHRQLMSKFVVTKITMPGDGE